MTIAQLDRHLAEHGRFVPLDAPHAQKSTVGGVLAARIDQRVISRQVGPTGNPEDVLHALGLQALHKRIRGSHRVGDATSDPTPTDQGF